MTRQTDHRAAIVARENDVREWQTLYRAGRDAGLSVREAEDRADEAYAHRRIARGAAA